MFIRSTFTTIFAAGLTLAMVPLGCGAAQEEYSHALQPQQETASETKEWTMPEEVVEKWRGCVKQHASELRTYSHETKFEVKVDNDGVVKIVNLRHSTLHHDALESCLSNALAGLSIPPSVFPERASSVPFSGGESMRDTRAPLGIAQAAGGALVVFGPIVLIAAGVTLGVYVAVAVTEQAIEAAKLTKREKWCMEQVYRCVGSGYECDACLFECRRGGYWPDWKCPLSRPN